MSFYISLPLSIQPLPIPLPYFSYFFLSLSIRADPSISLNLIHSIHPIHFYPFILLPFQLLHSTRLSPTPTRLHFYFYFHPSTPFNRDVISLYLYLIHSLGPSNSLIRLHASPLCPSVHIFTLIIPRPPSPSKNFSPCFHPLAYFRLTPSHPFYRSIHFSFIQSTSIHFSLFLNIFVWLFQSTSISLNILQSLSLFPF